MPVRFPRPLRPGDVVGVPAPSAGVPRPLAPRLEHALDAVRHALGDLGVPVLADVECGHVPPYLVLVNGALARVEHGPDASVVTQRLA
ncbi:hypothetical protein [Isoptericola variabilis]|uniref:hypothetical protein n=1 Tax=Isoptericola variabilis TaxID=139208 RepID=UPI0003187CF9|nr:hypothetical protein [Isoptericola variabilis]TWH33966.1 putative proteins, homologs of microcin C7 resistance protein MccF [Isoptericola variabilis J7]